MFVKKISDLRWPLAAGGLFFQAPEFNLTYTNITFTYAL